MTIIGYYKLSYLDDTRLGIFSPGVAENTHSVQFFDSTVAEVALLGEQHLRHLPMVYLDQRTTYQLSFDETSDKSEVYIVNRPLLRYRRWLRTNFSRRTGRYIRNLAAVASWGC